jgi:exodeoxyribonuclease V alpha subunit
MTQYILRVQTIRSQDPLGIGGCIFMGRLISDHGTVVDAKIRYVVIVPGKLLKNTKVETGQWWLVTGEAREQVRIINGFSVKEFTIAEPINIVMLRTSGEHIVTMIGKSKEFSGIGMRKARALWDRFHEDLYDILDRGDITLLKTVLSEQSAQQSVVAWQKVGLSKVLHWLQKNGIDVGIGQKIIECFGRDAQAKIEEDPYRLLSFCAKWKTADLMARSIFGVKDDDPRRLQGAIEEALYRVFGLGHTVAPRAMVISQLQGIFGPQKASLNWKELIEDTLDQGLSNGSYVIGAKEMIYPLGPMVMEMNVADTLVTRLMRKEGVRLLENREVDAVVDDYQNNVGYPLTSEQRQAVHLANAHPLAVITGGAGVGKTTVLQALYQVYKKKGVRVHQMALSGRATKRMSEATALDAATIASFLRNIRPNDFEGQTVVVIDECSMVDIMTMSALCEMLPKHVRLVLTGDPYQLMPVGPGLVLHALVDVAEIPKIELTVVKRYQGAILEAALSIRRGEWPSLPQDQDADICFIPCEKTRIAETVFALYNIAPSNTQILTPRRNSFEGTKQLNDLCQHRYTSNAKPMLVFSDVHQMNAGTGFNLHDLVMCTRNRWDVGLQNGSLGKIVEIEEAPKLHKTVDGEEIGYSLATVEWDDGIVRPLFESMLDDIELGYAITIHKAQGSQWPRIIIPLTKSRLLDRTLIYTAVTRARTQVIIVGNIEATKRAVESAPKAKGRAVALRYFLESALQDEKHRRAVSENIP